MRACWKGNRSLVTHSGPFTDPVSIKSSSNSPNSFSRLSTLCPALSLCLAQISPETSKGRCLPTWSAATAHWQSSWMMVSSRRERDWSVSGEWNTLRYRSDSLVLEVTSVNLNKLRLSSMSTSSRTAAPREEACIPTEDHFISAVCLLSLSSCTLWDSWA